LANEITFTVKLDDKGSLALVTKEAKKTAAGIKNVDNTTKKANKTQDHFARGAKGVGQAGLSASKGFSKMRDSMGGSNGLVSAYAILAANIFAATAAFNALRRAAQIEQLAEGLKQVGAVAGQNLPDIANQLKTITGNAVSAEIAMRSTALAVSAGFRSDQLISLTKVAKGASIALGRDMGDALDRLVRGTAKLEPEILDELGIMVRLDDAVRVYADRLGIAESSLTQFDRRQAFLNATIEQGLKKFEDLSNSIDANPYDKLAASLADLQKNFIKTFSSFTGLNKMVSFASRNLSALTAVATTLALGITRGVAPGLFRMADSAAASANGLLESRLALADVTTAGDKLPPKFKKLVGSLKEGTATSTEFAAANRSLTGQLGALTKGLNRTKEGTAEYAVMQDRISGVRTQITDLSDLEQLQGKARIEGARASAIGNAANFNLSQSFKDLKTVFAEDTETTKINTEGKKGLKNSMKKLGPAFRIAGTGAKAFGGALFTALPYIGLIISGVSILFNFIKERFFPEDLVKKRIDEAKKSFEQFSEIQARFMTSTAKGNERTVESFIALAGILDQISGKIRSTADENMKGLVEEITEQNNALLEQKQILDQRKEALEIEKTYGNIKTKHDNIASIMLEILGIEQEMDRITEVKNTKMKEGETIQRTTAKEVLNGALAQLKIQQDIAKHQKKNSFNSALMATSIEKLTKLAKELEKGEMGFPEFLARLDRIQRYPNEVRAAFSEIGSIVQTFNATMSKRTQSVKKLYQEEEEGAQAVVDKFIALEKASKERVTTDFAIGPLTDSAVEAGDALEELNKKIEGLNIKDNFGKGVEGVRTFITFIQTSRQELARLQKTLAHNKSQFIEVSKAAKGIVGGQALVDELSNSLLQEEIDLLDKQLIRERRISLLKGEEYDTTKEGQKVILKIAELEGKIVDKTVLKKKANLENNVLMKQALELSKKQMTNDKRLFEITAKARSAGGKLTPKEEFELEVRSAKLAVETAKVDLQIVIIKAKLQREMLNATMIANNVEEEHRKAILALLDKQHALTEKISRESIRSAQIGVTETIQGGMGATDTGMSRIATGGSLSSMTSQISSMENYSKAVVGRIKVEEQLKALQKESGSLQDRITEESNKEVKDQGLITYLTEQKAAVEEQISSVNNVLTQAQQNVKNSAIDMVNSTIVGMSQALAELGPEGALAASFASLSSIMLTSVVGALEVIKANADDTAMQLAAGFAAAASIIGGIASILQAQSNVAVEAIDKQIDAEKKLDGQSAKSVEKIKAMEAKKEAIKKKTFETDKKLKIAQAIMATAAGIAQALTLGPILGPIMAGIIGAMGMAQIAVISGMSYQGGGSASAPATPSRISIGERGKGVDLATSRSARGELAYMRGEDGTGGSGNFRPAFTGAKYRASGGETAGFMVGEQGPEMFIPDRSGRIAPADDVQTAGAPAQVTFNINTIDASGVEDMLTVQRGNIIGMIRSAANSYGETFVEEVDTTMLQNTASAMGVGRY